MALQVYNTLTNKKEEVVPVTPGKITMYLCGPTVYDYFHIGNARPFIVYDIFRRYLKYRGYDVKFVMNVTDIDDKIITKAIKEAVPASEVAGKYTNAFFEDLEKLGVEPADEYPKATENINEIIALIERLIDKGLAYQIEGDVYYSVAKFSGYGKLSGKNIEELKSGARIEIDARKKNPLDFSLWKAAKPGEPAWDSPWGKGRPGWHIECSVMSMKYLGETIDIHAGGSDLVFPHHENEIAQSEGASGKPFVKYWMHNGFLNIEGEKMSKSLGNFFTARDIMKKYHASVIRMFFLQKHYKSPVSFSEDRILESQNALERIITAMQNIDIVLKDIDFEDNDDQKVVEQIAGLKSEFLKNMDDDFNTAGAMSNIFDLVKEANHILSKTSLLREDYITLKEIRAIIEEFDSFLGILSYKEEMHTSVSEDSLISILLDVREQLRKEKLWNLSDEIRDKLANLGVEIKDYPDKTIWMKKIKS
ncbi:cysteine--tRNA ligase [candidate division KSB1 bacterium 4572_119]|nr:MAG: cysteine--tRNA ligase [candidate division KSB1 bacterium 4572_119]